MQTTIRVDEDVAEMLEKLKKEEHVKSYNEIIKKLLKMKKISMFGVDKDKLGEFRREESDRF